MKSTANREHFSLNLKRVLAYLLFSGSLLRICRILKQNVASSRIVLALGTENRPAAVARRGVDGSYQSRKSEMDFGSKTTKHNYRAIMPKV